MNLFVLFSTFFTVSILSFLITGFLAKLFYKIKLNQLLVRFYYRFFYHNYEIWIKSRMLSKEDCDKFLKNYEQSKALGRFQNDRNLKRYEEAVKVRLNKLNAVSQVEK